MNATGTMVSVRRPVTADEEQALMNVFPDLTIRPGRRELHLPGDDAKRTMSFRKLLRSLGLARHI